MAKQAEKVRHIIEAKCEAGEQLRSVGLFWSGGIWALMWMWLMKNYWIGVTDKKLIVIRIDAFGEPVTNEMQTARFSDVKLQGNKILVKLPGINKPQDFRMRFGLKSITGFDIDEFKAALTN